MGVRGFAFLGILVPFGMRASCFCDNASYKRHRRVPVREYFKMDNAVPSSSRDATMDKDDDLLNDSYAEQLAEVCSIDLENMKFSIIDLLYELWNPDYGATRNMRAILTAITDILGIYNEKNCNVNVDAARMKEGRDINFAMLEIYGAFVQCDFSRPTCSKREMYEFLRSELPRRFYKVINEDIMTEKSFKKWSHDCRVRMLSAPQRDTNEGTAKKRELDALFTDTPLSTNDDGIQQHITKLDNGRIFTVKSPGECGSQLIRLYLYDVKDIAKKDKRHWWKSAKIRTQFLLDAPLDRKRKLVTDLLDEVAKHLKGVPGISKELKRPFNDDEFLRDAKEEEKRKRIATHSLDE